MTTNIKALASQVASLTDPEDINIVIRAIKTARTHRSIHAKMQFAPGDRVYWQNKYGQNTCGTVERILPKNVMVTADTGTKWRVSPTFLKHL